MADYSFVILGDFKSTGGIFAATENGDNLQDIIEDLSTAYCIDDMVFDSKGGFYFTDFRGYSTNPLGGVYYVLAGLQNSDAYHSKY